MSSGIEILVILPLLLPGVMSGGAVAGATTLGAATTGGVVVTGSSIATTSAFATGSLAASSGAATTVATGATLAGGAIFVVGAAGAALLAAHHLQSTYNAARADYERRVSGERAEVQAARRLHHEAANAVLLQIQNSRMQASESADLAFLRSGLRKLKTRLGDSPGVDPNLPDGCARLLQALEQPSPDVAALFAAYEVLNTSVSTWAAKQRELLQNVSSASGTETLRIALEAEISTLREEVELAPAGILNDNVREALKRALNQVKSLVAVQPQMAEQGIGMLRARVGRELSMGATREATQREAQEKFAARLRELAGRVSARSQATLTVLDNEELAASPVAQKPIRELQTSAQTHLKRLAVLLAGELPPDLAPLEKLANEADAVFERCAERLRQIALQIYLESQVTEIFTQLGYRVTTVSDSKAERTGMVATLGQGQGVEVRVDGTGNLSSEMVALSPSATEIEPHTQEKVCDLMDEVFDRLRARGCGVREKKRRHARKGEHPLRVVKLPETQPAPMNSVAAPLARQIES